MCADSVTQLHLKRNFEPLGINCPRKFSIDPFHVSPFHEHQRLPATHSNIKNCERKKTREEEHFSLLWHQKKKKIDKRERDKLDFVAKDLESKSKAAACRCLN